MKKAEREYLNRLSALGCIACAIQGTPGTPAEIHHPRSGKGVSQRADHFAAIPLCPAHHRGTMHPQVPSVHLAPKAFFEQLGSESELIERAREMLEWAA